MNQEGRKKELRPRFIGVIRAATSTAEMTSVLAHLLLLLRTMRPLFAACLIFAYALQLSARQMPLTAKEISLMLRSGYSSEAVMREVVARRFADTWDSAAEKSLVQAGATSALLSTLKSGAYSMSGDEAIRAKEEIAEQAHRRVDQAQQSRQFDTLYQVKVAQERALGASQPAAPNAIYPLLKGDLVYWKNGSLARFDDEPLAKKKLYALYFSAHWCAPCRKFTPQLVEFYNRTAPQHPEFELIFVSDDRAAFNMEIYMKEANMPWPAVDFAKVSSKGELKKYEGKGIPCLVLIDATGKVISDSYEGEKYLGPGKVVADLERTFAQQTAGPIAQQR